MQKKMDKSDKKIDPSAKWTKMKHLEQKIEIEKPSKFETALLYNETLEIKLFI